MIRLRGPKDMLGPRPKTEAELQGLARAVPGAHRLGRADVIARVDWGRWVADCPCRAGVAVHPEWATTGCLECGRILNVTVPSEFRDIEDALLERSEDSQRHWDPSKTVETLRAETQALAELQRARGVG